MNDEHAVETVRALVAALEQGDCDARAQAAQALGRLGAHARAAVPALIVALADPDWRIWSHAGRALFEIGPDVAAVPALVQGLKEGRPHIRFWSARALAKTRPSPITVLPALLEAVREEDNWPVVGSVWWALHVIGPPSVAPLADMLQQGDQRSRRRAAYCLLWGSVERMRQSVAPLLAALDDADLHVRATALQALAQNARGCTQATGLLDEVWDSVPQIVSRHLADGEVGIRREAAHVLERFGAAAGPVADALLRAAQDGDEMVRARAVRTLTEIRQRDRERQARPGDV